MSKPSCVDKVLHRCNQPAIDAYTQLIREGHWQRAIKQLLADEGRWLSERDATAFVLYVRRTLPAPR